MRTFRVMFSLLGVLLLAACGGGSLTGAPPAAGDGVRGLDGSTVAFENGTLWAAFSDGGGLYEFPTNGSGALTPLATLGAGMESTDGPPLQFADVAVAPDGTVYTLVVPVFGSPTPAWRVNVYSPGSLEREHVINSTGRATSLALGGDGILVQVTMPGAPAPVIKTFPYGATDPPAMRKFHMPPGYGGFAVSNDDLIYLRRLDGYDAYPITSTDACCPVESITTTRPPNAGTRGTYAVGPDNSIYEADIFPPPRGSTQGTMYVDVYPPHSGTVARRIGPLPTYVSGFSRGPVITVDRNNRLYVATAGSIYRFGTRANGASTPQRVITTPVGGYQAGLAIGP